MIRSLIVMSGKALVMVFINVPRNDVL
jgi:hypothetical protein